MFPARFFPVRAFAPTYFPKVGATADTGTGTIAYNPALFAAMQARTYPKLHIPTTKEIKPQEQHYATDYAIPCQRVKLLSFPGEIVPDVHRYVAVCGSLAGTVKIISVGRAIGASYAKSYSGKPGGIADVVGRKRHIKRLRVRALREERALMAALSRGVSLGDAIQEMVRT